MNDRLVNGTRTGSVWLNQLHDWVKRRYAALTILEIVTVEYVLFGCCCALGWAKDPASMIIGAVCAGSAIWVVTLFSGATEKGDPRFVCAFHAFWPTYTLVIVTTSWWYTGWFSAVAEILVVSVGVIAPILAPGFARRSAALEPSPEGTVCPTP